MTPATEAADPDSRLAADWAEITLPPRPGEGLVEWLPAAIYRCDENRRLQLANGTLRAFLGIEPHEVRGTLLDELVHTEDRARVAAAWTSAIRSGRSFECEYRLATADGRTLWVADRAAREPRAGSRMLVAGMMTETTTRKVYEESLEAANGRLRRALRQVNCGIVECDLVLDKAYCSDHMRQLLGYGDDEIAFARAFSLETALHPEDRDRVLAAIGRQIGSGERFDEECRLERADGTYAWFRARGEAVRAADGVPAQFVCSMSDIDREKAAELGLRAAKADLEARVAARTQELTEANRELKTFSYSVAHDLRGPLRAVDGYSRLALETARATDNAELVRHLERVVDRAGYMTQMIEGLLTLSRLARQDLASQPVDMRAVAASVAEELGPQHGGRAELEIGPLAPCRGDPVLLRQVWANLIDNALKFSAIRACPRIAATCERLGDEIVYRVQDNGAGFDPAHAARLFGVFERLHSEREFPGTGIGLATVKRIVERHGGRAWAASAPGEGATFAFALPAGRPPAA